jgi:two-component system, OmpR family, sensor histidine kinase CreC
MNETRLLRSKEKWRPSLGLIVFAVLAFVAALPLIGLFFFRLYDNQLIRQTETELIALALAMIATTMIIGLVFFRTITHPMRELIGRAERIGRGDRDAFQPLAHYGTREFAQLSRSFLGMAEQLSRRSDYIATFSAHLTHELKSPLTSIKGAAELLLDSLQDGASPLTRMQQRSFLSNILDDAERLETMTQRLRELARAESAQQHERAELGAVVLGLRSRFPTCTITAAGCLDRMIGMSMEKALIVLSHLADNAVRHNAKTIRLDTSSENTTIRMTVSNDGDPISESNRDKIFDAFFTTCRDAGGTGMGLAIVKAVMTSHGGWIRLLPADAGTAFELRFPAA